MPEAQANDVAIRHNPSTVWPVPNQFRGIYSHAVQSPAGRRWLHVSGQVGVAPDGTWAADFEPQCAQALANVKALLAEAGMAARDVVKVTYYLTRAQDLPLLSAIRAEQFEGAVPAVTTLLVAGLVNPDWLVEIDVIAAAP